MAAATRRSPPDAITGAAIGGQGRHADAGDVRARARWRARAEMPTRSPVKLPGPTVTATRSSDAKPPSVARDDAVEQRHQRLGMAARHRFAGVGQRLRAAAGRCRRRRRSRLRARCRWRERARRPSPRWRGGPTLTRCCRTPRNRGAAARGFTPRDHHSRGCTGNSTGLFRAGEERRVDAGLVEAAHRAAVQSERRAARISRRPAARNCGTRSPGSTAWLALEPVPRIRVVREQLRHLLVEGEVHADDRRSPARPSSCRGCRRTDAASASPSPPATSRRRTGPGRCWRWSAPS